MSDPGLEDAAQAISALLETRSAEATICPSDAARKFDGDAWRELMPLVHEAARMLVSKGDVVLTQGGVVTSPDQVVGAYRIRKA